MPGTLGVAPVTRHPAVSTTSERDVVLSAQDAAAEQPAHEQRDLEVETSVAERTAAGLLGAAYAVEHGVAVQGQLGRGCRVAALVGEQHADRLAEPRVCLVVGSETAEHPLHPRGKVGQIGAQQDARPASAVYVVTCVRAPSSAPRATARAASACRWVVRKPVTPGGGLADPEAYSPAARDRVRIGAGRQWQPGPDGGGVGRDDEGFAVAAEVDGDPAYLPLQVRIVAGVAPPHQAEVGLPELVAEQALGLADLERVSGQDGGDLGGACHRLTLQPLPALVGVGLHDLLGDPVDVGERRRRDLHGGRHDRRRVVGVARERLDHQLLGTRPGRGGRPAAVR